MSKTEDFLKLIGAPWAAYHDHPDAETAASMAQIRSARDPNPHGDEVCMVLGCDNPDDFHRTGAIQRARRDLIAKAPRMYEYIAKMAENGDTEAKMILRQIHGDAS